jgi:hypothetical protein
MDRSRAKSVSAKGKAQQMLSLAALSRVNGLQKPGFDPVPAKCGQIPVLHSSVGRLQKPRLISCLLKKHANVDVLCDPFVGFPVTFAKSSAGCDSFAYDAQN